MLSLAGMVPKRPYFPFPPIPVLLDPLRGSGDAPNAAGPPKNECPGGGGGDAIHIALLTLSGSRNTEGRILCGV